MILCNNSNISPFLSSILASDTPIDEEKLATLKVELTTDPEGLGYGSMTHKQIQSALGNVYYKDITIPEVTEPILAWDTDVLYNILLQANTPATFTSAPDTPVLIVIDEMRNNSDPNLAGLAKLIWLTINSNLKAINLENPKVLGGITKLYEIGMLSPELYKLVTTKVLEESYVEHKAFPPRILTLFGDYYFPSVSDIALALS